MSDTWENSRMYVLKSINEHAEEIQKLQTSTNRLQLDNNVNLNQQTKELTAKLSALDSKIVRVVAIQNLLLAVGFILLKFVFKVL